MTYIDLESYRLTDSAQRALNLAFEAAAWRGDSAVQPRDLLQGILALRERHVTQLLASVGADQAALEAALRTDGGRTGTAAPTLSPDAALAINDARREAGNLGHAVVAPVHLLLGLLYDHSGEPARLMGAQNIGIYELRTALIQQPSLAPNKGGYRAPPRARHGWSISPIFLGLLAVLILSGGALYTGVAANIEPLIGLVFIISGWVISVCLHEFGHAIVAYYGGDTSVVDQGYLTLNPLRYTHPLISIGLPVIILLMGGIGLPGGAVYINRGALRSKVWHSYVSAAGPLATFLCAILCALPFLLGLHSWGNSFWWALAFLGGLQVTALFFNLLPIPGLDGFGIISPWLPENVQQTALMFGNMLFLIFFFMMMSNEPLQEWFWTNVITGMELLRIPPIYFAEALRSFFFWR